MRWAGLLCLLALSGCIQQELTVKLNADGSGVFLLRRKLHENEALMVDAGDARPSPSFRHLTLTESFEEKKDGTWHIATYRFKALGPALPELEHEIPMRPRFTVRDGRFIVFLNRERSKFEGQNSSKEEIASQFYHLTLELPAEPRSATGSIEGRKVSWRFDGEALEKIRKKAIGTPVLDASIPAAAIKVDLTPRFAGESVRKKGSSDRKKPVPRISGFQATIPVVIDPQKRRSEKNASLTAYFPIGDLPIPFSYNEIKILEFRAGGKACPVTLRSPSKGIFSGQTRMGHRTPHFPVAIAFDLNDPWQCSVDAFNVEITVEKPTKTKRWPLVLTDFSNTGKVSLALGSDKKLIVTKCERGTSTALIPGPSLSFVTNTDPSRILHLDVMTRYGLKYRTGNISWEKKRVSNIWKSAVKKLAIALAGEKGTVHIGEATVKQIPNPPLTIVFETMTETTEVKQVLTLEERNASIR